MADGGVAVDLWGRPHRVRATPHLRHRPSRTLKLPSPFFSIFLFLAHPIVDFYPFPCWDCLRFPEVRWFLVFCLVPFNPSNRYALYRFRWQLPPSVFCLSYPPRFARMSTGVDNQKQPKKFIDLDNVARNRSASRSNGSAVPLPVESDRVFDKLPNKMVSQSQKSRWLKTGAIVGFIFMVLLWLSPSKPAVSGFAHGMRPANMNGTAYSTSTKLTTPLLYRESSFRRWCLHQVHQVIRFVQASDSICSHD